MSASAARTTNLVAILCACLIAVGCTASAKNETFFGKTNPPRENVLRYVSGSEPESIDPQIPIGQNGEPITARDFVYTIRRGLTPVVGARYASLAYPLKYAEAFNEGGVFVFDPA